MTGQARRFCRLAPQPTPMFSLEFNGKPFDPKSFTDTIMKGLTDQVADNIREKIGAIRDPDTGAFPTVVVYADSLQNIRYRVEGSDALLALVNERMQVTPDAPAATDTLPQRIPPKVFLSYGGEDAVIARTIAAQLQAHGVETWFAEWDLFAGDSLRQKIDDGIAKCSHFVALLTRTSKHKPWVNVELDAGLSRKIGGNAKMIVLRYQLQASELPPTLQGLMSPEVLEPDFNVDALINDIHEVTKKPRLGAAPLAFTHSMATETGYSPAATLIAKLFVESTVNAESFNPQIPRESLLAQTGLTEEDATDALYELRDYITTDSFNGTARPKHELYAEFDKYWKPWNPEVDALRLATDMLNETTFSTHPSDIATRYDWAPRRLNPALSYLIARELILHNHAMGSSSWIVLMVQKTAATRRFVKSRA